jgi:alpha-galactosidase
MTHISSPYFHLTLNPEKGTWSLSGMKTNHPTIDDAWLRVSYFGGLSTLFRTGKQKFSFIEKWVRPQISGPIEIDSVHGKLNQISVEMGPDVNGIRYRLKFALSDEYPLFLWRVILENEGVKPVEIDKIELLRAGFFPKKRLLPTPGPLTGVYNPKPVGYGSVRPNPEPGELRFFSNGWQSWSHTGSYGPEDVYRGTRLDFLAEQMWYARGKSPKREAGNFISDMFGIIGDSKHRTGILAGFLSQKQHFGTVEAHIANPLYPALALWSDGDRAQIKPGRQMTTDWAVIQFVDIDTAEPIAPYLDAVAREHNLPPTVSSHPSSVGWCSWYHFFQDIDVQKMRTNLESAAGMKDTVPFDLFQIDDGFEAQIGDWFDFNPGFPNGVASLAEDINAKGFTPGLWLAPFIVHSRSKLANNRKWLLRNRWGLPVNTGFVWNNLNTALDITHPDALEYVRKTVQTAAQEWGYPYLKLDFLYAAAVKTGRYRDRTKTRAQVLRMGLEAIREAVGPEVTLLGCGVPLGAAIGIFEAMRIGADVDPSWAPHFGGIQLAFQNEPNMPGTRNALQNTLTRAPFHNRWWVNDPDCLIIRPDSDLSLAEVQSLATAIALTGGALLLSDDLPQLPAERLNIAAQLIPIIGKRPRVLDWFDANMPQFLRLDLENETGRWHLIAVFNWDNQARDVSLSLDQFDLLPGDYFWREFWTGAGGLISGGQLDLEGIPAHGVKAISLTPNPSPNGRGRPLYLGSDLHISQGLEISDWRVSPTNGVCFKLVRPGKAVGEIELYLPESPERIFLNEKEVSWQSLGEQRYRIQVEFKKFAEVEIK